jgi:hypothetical protein
MPKVPRSSGLVVKEGSIGLGYADSSTNSSSSPDDAPALVSVAAALRDRPLRDRALRAVGPGREGASAGASRRRTCPAHSFVLGGMGSRRQWRRRRRALGIVLAALAVAACGSASNRPINGGVAYLIGYSTDPYGSSDPRGFGVATGITESPLRRTEATSPRAPSEIAWLGGRRLVVRSGAGLSGRPPAALFEVGDGRLERLDGPELRPEERTFAWSPDRKLLATQPWVPGGCEPGTLPQNCGITPGRDVYVQRSDGSHRRRVASGLLRAGLPTGAFCSSGAGTRMSRRAHSFPSISARGAGPPFSRAKRSPPSRTDVLNSALSPTPPTDSTWRRGPSSQSATSEFGAS